VEVNFIEDNFEGPAGLEIFFPAAAEEMVN